MSKYKLQKGDRAIYTDSTNIGPYNNGEPEDVEVMTVEGDDYRGALPYQVLLSTGENTWVFESELVEKIHIEKPVVKKSDLRKLDRFDLTIEEQYYGSGDLVIEEEKCANGEWVKWSDVKNLIS